MSFLIFPILLILSIWAVVWCVLKFLGQQVRYDFDTVHLRPMPRDENVARRLNAIWNRDPRDGRDDPTGYKKCMVFLHAFDYQNGKNTEGGGWDGACRVSSNCPWCPCVRGQVHPKFLNLIGITHVPSTSLSFSAFNRHITRDGKIMFGNVGLVFDFENTADETISPLCYYPTDGWTGARTSSGCGPIGVKWSPTPFSPEGYAKAVLPSFDEMSDAQKSRTKAALDYPGFLNTVRQPSLNFRQFVDVSLAIMSESTEEGADMSWRHNEVIIQNWVNVNFDAVPLSAFYFVEGNAKARQQALQVADACFINTRRRIPVVSFNPRPDDQRTPFRLVQH